MQAQSPTLLPADLPAEIDRERGAALLMAFFFILMLVSFSYLMLSSYQAQSSSTMFRIQHGQALEAADVGLAKAKLLLTADPVGSGGGTDFSDGTLWSSEAGATFSAELALISVNNATVTIQEINTQSTPYVFQIRSAGANATGQTRTIEMILILEQSKVPANAPGLGAIVADGTLDVTGNITVNGNDHDVFSQPPGGGKNVPGVVTTGSAVTGGSSNIGGSGHDPNDPIVEDESIDSNSNVWMAENLDDDPLSPNFGLPDPAKAGFDTDGLDNDGDGSFDEDGFPTSPGDVLNQPDEVALIQTAKDDGTFFESLSEYNAWRSATSSVDQGGKIIYIQVANGTDINGNFNLPSNAASTGADPSIVIVAGVNASQHDTQIGPVKAPLPGFQGYFIADTIKNMNGNGQITGSVLAFNPGDTSHTGNGNMTVNFSSDVLGNLPGIAQAGSPWIPGVQSWRER